MRELYHFFDGRRVSGVSGRFVEGFEPMMDRTASRVPLASKVEARAAGESSVAAQPGWAAVNPQRGARVLTRFVDLVAREMEALAELLAGEHGKTILDAKGDIQRGLDVVEFSTGSRI